MTPLQEIIDRYYIGRKDELLSPLAYWPLCTFGVWNFTGNRTTFREKGNLENCILRVASNYDKYSDIMYYRSMVIEPVQIFKQDTAKTQELQILRNTLASTSSKAEHYREQARRLRLALKQGV